MVVLGDRKAVKVKAFVTITRLVKIDAEEDIQLLRKRLIEGFDNGENLLTKIDNVKVETTSA